MSEEVLKDLPESWEWTKLGEVIIKIVGGGTPSKNTAKYWGGNIPWLTIKDMRTQRPADTIDHITQEAVDESSTNLIPADTVIMATRVGLGKVVRVPYATTINQDLKALITPPELDKSYLEYWLVLKAQYLGSIGSGTTVKGIRLEQVKGLDFPLAPAEQQKRIVAKIEELFSHIDAGVAALNKAKQLLKQYRQSVLKAAVTGELTKQWREDNKDKLEPSSQLLERILKERRQKWEAQQLEQFKAKRKVPKDDKWKGKYKLEEPNPHMEFESPKEWAVSTIESITDPVRVICYGILMPKENVEDGVLYVKVKDVKFGRVLVDQLNRTVPEIAAKYARASLVMGDLLLTIRGTYGRTAIAPKELNGGNITQDTVRISAIEPILNEYLIIFVDSVVAQQYFKVVARGVAVKGVNVQDVRNMNVPIPSVEEQKEIIKLVDQKITTIAHVEKELEEQLLKAGKNKQSILASAFSGMLIDAA
jgi:type I restriction enzyme S subunit